MFVADPFEKYRICVHCKGYVTASLGVVDKPVEPVPNRNDGSTTDGGVHSDSVTFPFGGATGTSF